MAEETTIINKNYAITAESYDHGVSLRMFGPDSNNLFRFSVPCEVTYTAFMSDEMKNDANKHMSYFIEQLYLIGELNEKSLINMIASYLNPEYSEKLMKIAIFFKLKSPLHKLATHISKIPDVIRSEESGIGYLVADYLSREACRVCDPDNRLYSAHTN